jgi:predicted DNA-binding WGR domain protein
MNKVDINYSVYGFYNFYRMQLIRRRGVDNLFIMFTQWGRIGDDGQYQRTPFTTLDAAEKEFAKIYKQKTDNEWTASEFKIKPKRYRLVEEHADGPEQAHWTDMKLPELDVMSKDTKEDIRQVDDKAVRAMIRDVTNVDALKRNAKSVQYTRQGRVISGLLPFGRISAQRLSQAIDIVDRIEAIIKEKEKLDTRTHAEQQLALMQQLVDLSQSYHDTLLLGVYAHSQLPVIDDVYRLAGCREAIDQLMHMETAAVILTGACVGKVILWV